MRVSVATAFLAATAALASPHAAPANHDAVAKRLREREAMRELSMRFGRGEHDIDEVPDGLEYHGDTTTDDDLLFADGPVNDDEDFIFSPNGTSEVVTERDVDEILERGKVSKVLIPWTNEVPAAWPLIGKQKVFGTYTWTQWRPKECDKYKIPFFPMLKSDKFADGFKKQCNKKGYADGYHMGPNEVNIKSQSPMNAGHASWLINTYSVPIANKFGLKIVSMSFANGPTVIPWLKQFQKVDPKLFNRFHAICLHYYGTNPDAAIKYFQDFHKVFPNKKIWITELGCQSYSGRPQCDQAQANNYLKKISDYARKNDYIENVGWYTTFVSGKSKVGMGKTNAMFANKNAALTQFGKNFLAL